MGPRVNSAPIGPMPKLQTFPVKQQIAMVKPGQNRAKTPSHTTYTIFPTLLLQNLFYSIVAVEQTSIFKLPLTFTDPFPLS